MPPIITVDRLAKAYRIGLKDEIPDTLVGAVTGLAKAPVRKFRQLRRLNTYGTGVQGTGSGEQGEAATPADIVWALRDVSFEIEEGDVLGVIGRNGAGKSTLLKILSRITEPTSGRAVLRGRVSSLLEVGTGFHPELTSRDNVYMNGTILGMTKREIDAKFDEIVDFSGVEKFLDTPIKRYSSGMQVRLAFAVAAHLEPEILIVDEVLAVGDAEFQKKCMGKMQDVARGGRTILFVSHNTVAMEALCSHGIYLRHGSISYAGAIDKVLKQYRDDVDTTPHSPLNARIDREGDGAVRLTGITVANRRNKEAEIRTGHDISIMIEYESTRPRSNVEISLGIVSSSGQRISWLGSTLTSHLFDVETRGAFICNIDHIPLLSDTYSVNLQCRIDGRVADWIQEAAYFSVYDGDFFGYGKQYPFKWGVMAIPHEWDAITTTA